MVHTNNRRVDIRIKVRKNNGAKNGYKSLLAHLALYRSPSRSFSGVPFSLCNRQMLPILNLLNLTADSDRTDPGSSVNNIATIPQINGITLLLVHSMCSTPVQQVAQTQSRCVRIVFEAAVVELCSCQLNCLIGPPPSPRPTSTAALISYVGKYICVCVWL